MIAYRIIEFQREDKQAVEGGMNEGEVAVNGSRTVESLPTEAKVCHFEDHMKTNVGHYC